MELVSGGLYIIDSNTLDTEEVNYTYNSAGELTQITTESTTYSFVYDSYGNTDEIRIGNAQIAEYEYYSNNGKLKKVIYSNGFAKKIFYIVYGLPVRQPISLN